MSLSTPILTTSSEIDTRVDDCSATAVVMKDDTDKAQMMSVFLIMGLLRKMSSAAPPSDVTDSESNPRHRLLCACRERPSRSAAEQRDELAPFHSITSSARTNRVSGIVRPSALAVVRLMRSWNFVGCSTGKSLG